MEERCRDRACEDDEHGCNGRHERREGSEDEYRAERRVDRHEPPRVRVEVTEGEPQRVARLHPLTPAAVTPAMK